MFDERYLSDLGPFFDQVDRALQQARHDLEVRAGAQRCVEETLAEGCLSRV